MEEYKIKGWIARDKHTQNAARSDLYLFSQRPEWSESQSSWLALSAFLLFPIPQKWFPELKHTDEPIEVELIIKQRVEEQ